MSLASTLPLAAADAPAAGAPAVQIAIASCFAGITTAVLLALIMRERSGRSQMLGRAAARAGRRLGMEPWAALPFAMGVVALASGGFGVFWDVSLHIDVGRDEGPLANPSHYFILFALYGLFAAGLVSLALHERAERPSPAAIRLPNGMSAPVGGALLLVCGAFALTGFPLDDVWHRMFGQDVTLWGPTHLVMINGAILSVPVLALIGLESRRAAGKPLAAPARTVFGYVERVLLPGALLFAIAFWATEFDWGVPQYRMVWQPLLLAVAGGVGLACGRVWLGRGGAVGALAAYLVIRVALELAVLGLGRTVPAMPLFAAEALVIEAIAWRTRPERTPLRFGVLAGLVCGTVGFAAAYGWTQVWAPVPWNEHLLAEGLPTAIVAGVAGGLLGGLLGAGLRGELPGRSVRRPAAIGAALALVVLGANALWLSNPSDLRGTVTLSSVTGSGSQREAVMTIRPSDPALVRDAQMANVLAWQGGENLVVRQLREVAPGVWRTDGAVPLHGTWKTNLRVQSGRAFMTLPLHLPREPSIPTPGVTRPDHFTAAFVTDHAAMQTERRDYVPGWLWTPAALLMLAFCAAFITAIAFGVARIGDGAADGAAPRARRGGAGSGAGVRARVAAAAGTSLR